MKKGLGVVLCLIVSAVATPARTELPTWARTDDLRVLQLDAEVLSEDTAGYGAALAPWEFFDQTNSESFSPDSGMMVYTRNGGRYLDGIWLKSMAEEYGWCLAERGFDPHWAPCGDFIAFLRQRYAGEASDGKPRYGRAELWLTTRLGEEERLLTPGLNCHDYAWCPDGRMIAADVDGAGFGKHTSALVIIDTSTGERTVLDSLVHPELSMGSFSWSPNSQMLAYVLPLVINQEMCTIAVEDIRDSELFVINVDGTHKRQIADTPEIEEEVKWSSDGKRLITLDSNDSLRAILLDVVERR